MHKFKPKLKGKIGVKISNSVNIAASNWAVELRKTNKQKNPHGQLIWDGITFQSSIYYNFPLKPGCVKIKDAQL